MGIIDQYTPKKQEFLVEKLSLINQYMYHQLILYMANVQRAYQELNYSKVHRLSLDFLKTYIFDFYLDATKNLVISQYRDPLAQECLYIY